MIKVELLAHTEADPLELISHAALTCYQSEVPEMGKIIDVKNRLFDVGHHTTLQHWSASFSISGIAVGDVTFGLHLCHPFYDTDQRSGRFCAEMFLNPNFEEMERYIRDFWPEVKEEKIREIMAYVKKGFGIYQKNICQVGIMAKRFLKEERPFISDKMLESIYLKIAQEQLRMFIPVIFPTALDFTVNLSTLSAMYRAAWSPAMRSITQKMADLICVRYPEIGFMFNSAARRWDDWGVDFKRFSVPGLEYEPVLELLELEGETSFRIPSPEAMHPLDLLHFSPEMMENATGSILTRIEISLATMGQDQRHRTISRSQPAFTGKFYLPPVLRQVDGLEESANELLKLWMSFQEDLPVSLFSVLAPYGAMVEYRKRGNFNAVSHEQGKRLCWCAQEEIYFLAVKLRRAILEKYGRISLLDSLEPPCFKTGLCGEGKRYCGRDIRARKKGEEYFPERKV